MLTLDDSVNVGNYETIVSKITDDFIREFHQELSSTCDRAMELGWDRTQLSIRGSGHFHDRLVTVDPVFGREKYVLAEAWIAVDGESLKIEVRRREWIPPPE